MIHRNSLSTQSHSTRSFVPRPHLYSLIPYQNHLTHRPTILRNFSQNEPLEIKRTKLLRSLPCIKTWKRFHFCFLLSFENGLRGKCKFTDRTISFSFVKLLVAVSVLIKRKKMSLFSMKCFVF